MSTLKKIGLLVPLLLVSLSVWADPLPIVTVQDPAKMYTQIGGDDEAPTKKYQPSAQKKQEKKPTIKPAAIVMQPISSQTQSLPVVTVQPVQNVAVTATPVPPATVAPTVTEPISQVREATQIVVAAPQASFVQGMPVSAKEPSKEIVQGESLFSLSPFVVQIAQFLLGGVAVLLALTLMLNFLRSRRSRSKKWFNQMLVARGQV